MATPTVDSEYIGSGDAPEEQDSEKDSADEVSSDTQESTKDNESLDGDEADDIPKHDDDKQNSTKNFVGEENNKQRPMQENSEQTGNEESANVNNSVKENDGKCDAGRNSDHNNEKEAVRTDNRDAPQVVLEDVRNDEEERVMKNVLPETSQLKELEGSRLEKNAERTDVVAETQNRAEEAATVRKILRPKALEINKELAIGCEFPDYLSFKNTVARYCKAHGVTFVTAFSTTVAARNKQCAEPFAESLRFANLRLRCKYGGTQRASTARIRKSTMTCRTQCPSTMTVVARAKPDRLRVMYFVEEHNHELEPPTLQSSKGKTPWGRPNTKQNRRSEPPKVHRGLTTSKTSARQVVRALSDNLGPSKRSSSDPSTPRSPMVTFRPLSSLTLPTTLSSPHRSSTPRTPLSAHVARQKNVRGVPKRRLLQAARLSVDQDASCESLQDTPMAGPAFNKEITIDITDDVETEAADVKSTQTVAQVNEAWKCVYNILENDYRKLRVEAQCLRRENQRLRAATCTKCGSRQT